MKVERAASRRLGPEPTVSLEPGSRYPRDDDREMYLSVNGFEVPVPDNAVQTCQSADDVDQLVEEVSSQVVETLTVRLADNRAWEIATESGTRILAHKISPSGCVYPHCTPMGQSTSWPAMADGYDLWGYSLRRRRGEEDQRPALDQCWKYLVDIGLPVRLYTGLRE